VTIPEEIDAILLHEIGHVVHRHSMRQVIQSSAMTIAMVMFTGDASAMDEWTAALPAVLLQSHYSRDFESEADRYAFARMIQLNIDPAHFGRGLQRITDDAMKDSPLSEKDTQRTETFLKYFSSHPPSDERAAVAKQFSAQFQAQHPANPTAKE
jgi:Zn-dependent protease with chaperone function